MLLRHLIERPLSLAFASAGRSREAKIAIMAMTTSNSIRVNPVFLDWVKCSLVFIIAENLALFFGNCHVFLYR